MSERRVRLAYGHDGLEVDFPAERTTVVEPRHLTVTTAPGRLVRAALRNPVAGPPLRDIVRPGLRIAISICDGTRPQPRELMLTEIFDELDGVVRPDDVTIIVATGTHRGNTDAELLTMLGREVVEKYRIVNHDARDASTLVWCGRHGDDVPVWLARDWVEADVRITTGFVEPHFFAGFSGGPKLVAPGLAALETVLALHDARRIGHPKAIWGVCEGNPVHDDVRAIAAATGVDFACDVILDRDQRVVAAFGGEVLAMHAVAREEARRVAMVPVNGLFDVVVTTNAGHPLDQNLYQAVKGMSAAERAVRRGGLIVVAAQCRDGYPEHGAFRSTLEAAPSPAVLARDISVRTRPELDQWQVQVLARILSRARVAVHADGLSPAQLDAVHLSAAVDLSETVAAECRRVEQQAGRPARVCVLPEGPQTIPYLAAR
jgi:nickel-dependent lactate racemase